MIDRNNSLILCRSPLIINNFDTCNIAFEGRGYDPKGKDVWIRESLVPLDGTELSNCDAHEVVMYVLEIFGKKDGGSEQLTNIITELLGYYNAGEIYEYANVKGSIFKVENGVLIYQENWQKINFEVYFQLLNK